MGHFSMKIMLPTGSSLRENQQHGVRIQRETLAYRSLIADLRPSRSTGCAIGVA